MRKTILLGAVFAAVALPALAGDPRHGSGGGSGPITVGQGQDQQLNNQISITDQLNARSLSAARAEGGAGGAAGVPCAQLVIAATTPIPLPPIPPLPECGTAAFERARAANEAPAPCPPGARAVRECRRP